MRRRGVIPYMCHQTEGATKQCAYARAEVDNCCAGCVNQPNSLARKLDEIDRALPWIQQSWAERWSR